MFNKQCEERVIPVPPWLETTLMSSLKSQPAGGDLYELKPRYFEKLKAVAALLIPIWQAYIYIYIYSLKNMEQPIIDRVKRIYLLWSRG